MGARRWSALAGFAVLLAAASHAEVAWAQSASAEDALAEALFREGRQLMSDGRYPQACAKFAESQRLDPASGTLLNLAACHEAEHKYATAWLEYSEAVGWARRDQRDDRVTFAEDRIRSLEPLMSHLTVLLCNPKANVDGLEVEVDGIAFRDAARGVPAPVDPGPHRVDARAPKRKPWSQTVTFPESPADLTVTIPELELEQGAAPAAPLIPLPLPARPPEMTRPITAEVYVAGAVTLGAVFGATATGVFYLSKKTQYESSGAESDRRAALAAGWINAGFLLTAVAGAGVTGYLYWSRPWAPSAATAAPSRGASWAVAPWIGPAGSGLVVAGDL